MICWTYSYHFCSIVKNKDGNLNNTAYIDIQAIEQRTGSGTDCLVHGFSRNNPRVCSYVSVNISTMKATKTKANLQWFRACFTQELTRYPSLLSWYLVLLPPFCWKPQISAHASNRLAKPGGAGGQGRGHMWLLVQLLRLLSLIFKKSLYVTRYNTIGDMFKFSFGEGYLGQVLLCMVCATGLSEPLPHFMSILWQTIDHIFIIVTFGQMSLWFQERNSIRADSVKT